MKQYLVLRPDHSVLLLSQATAQTEEIKKMLLSKETCIVSSLDQLIRNVSPEKLRAVGDAMGFQEIKHKQDLATAIWDKATKGTDMGASEKKETKKPAKAKAAKPPKAARVAKPLPEKKPFREGTKQAKMADMLSRPEGASVEELMKALGWTKISVQTGFSWDLRQHGFAVDRDKEGRYHLKGKLLKHTPKAVKAEPKPKAAKAATKAKAPAAKAAKPAPAAKPKAKAASKPKAAKTAEAAPAASAEAAASTPASAAPAATDKVA